MRGGAYKWSNTSVKEKVGLSVRGLYVEGHRWKNAVFYLISDTLKIEMLQI